MPKEYILVIDLGTTNLKTLLLDRSCRVTKKICYEYSVSTPKTGWSEQDPEAWWEAVQQTIKTILNGIDSRAVRAVGLSGQMHGLVLMDEKGYVLRPAILWNDQRSFEECREIYATAGGSDRLLTYTNNPMIPGYTGGMLYWVKNHEPELFQRAAHVLMPKDYLRYRLTGFYATDVSDASGTGLFDVQRRVWAESLIRLLDIPFEWFPKAFEATDFVGTILPEIATELGLPANTPVSAGGGDAVMQTIGSAVTDQEKCLIVVGTGGNVTINTPAFTNNPGGLLQYFCNVIPGRWIGMGVTLTAGSSLKWFRDAFGGLERELARELAISPYQILDDMATRVSPGSRGVIFLPYLQGECCPNVDANPSGVFIGIRSNTYKPALARSVMEGVAYSLRDVLEMMIQTCANPKIIHLSGGGSTSQLWRQIFADILDRDVITMDYSEDASAVGAGIIAGIPAGYWSSAEEAAEMIPVKTISHPISAHVQVYQDLFTIYKNLYSTLKPSFDRLAQVVV
jgi:xylulokinase